MAKKSNQIFITKPNTSYSYNCLKLKYKEYQGLEPTSLLRSHCLSRHATLHPTSGEERCVLTLITAAKETKNPQTCKLFYGVDH